MTRVADTSITFDIFRIHTIWNYRKLAFCFVLFYCALEQYLCNVVEIFSLISCCVVHFFFRLRRLCRLFIVQWPPVLTTFCYI